MAQYFWLSIIACVMSAGLTSLLINVAKKKNIFIPNIRERDLHDTPTPRVGGIAIVVTFLVLAIGLLVFDSSALRFTDVKVIGIDKNLLGVLLAMLALTIVTVIDDWKETRWQFKLLSQIVAAVLLVIFGIKIQWLSNPFGNPLILGAWDGLFVVVWLTIITNVMNWVDNLDGLAGGVSAIALATLFYLSISPISHNSASALLAAIVFGAVIGFLPYNFRSQAFLGDTGAMFLGFMIGVLAIISGGKVATAFLVLSIPFFDAVVVFFTRVLSRQSPFLPDRRHLTHRLLDSGFKKWQIVGLYYVVSMLFGLIALNTQSMGKLYAVISALVLMGVMVLLYAVAAKRQSAKIERS